MARFSWVNLGSSWPSHTEIDWSESIWVQVEPSQSRLKWIPACLTPYSVKSSQVGSMFNRVEHVQSSSTRSRSSQVELAYLESRHQAHIGLWPC